MFSRWMQVGVLAILAACGAPANGRPHLEPIVTTTAPSVSSAAVTSIAVSAVVVTTPAATPAATPSTAAVATTFPNPVGRVVDRAASGRAEVALTFDAPLSDVMEARLNARQVPSYSNDALLATLAELDVPATFFLAGRWAERYPEQLGRIASNPIWEMGSFGYGYRSFTPKCGDLVGLRLDEMSGDVERGFETLRAAGGRLVPYFRFPGQCSDEQAIARLQPLRVTIVSGDVFSGDTTGAAASTIAAGVLSHVTSGSIVVLNMTKVGASNTEPAIRQIVAGLQAKGLRPVALSTLLVGT